MQAYASRTKLAQASGFDLICNAHLDPVWLWDWDEGIAAALATFRSAADLCGRWPNFVFNHNEALLYEWTELYDPPLFRRIRSLIRKGKWHVMGGWFLQPDCNLPSGEGIVRQIEYGRAYFREKFGVRPTTAVNVDPFGHSRGLVQILRKAGFDSYLFCRPGTADRPLALPDNEFLWEGFDGSTIRARRAQSHYHSAYGQAVAKITKHRKDYPGAELDLVLWGVGNHGGGPSREDLAAIAVLQRKHPEYGLRHSTPESYFRRSRRVRPRVPNWASDLNPWAVGCYSSQARIKQDYRRLENELFAVEKLCTYADLQSVWPYPKDQLAGVERDLLLAQFHDILPGSSVATVERSGLRLIAHGLEKLARLRRGPLFAFAARSPGRARQGEVPIFVFNPHPYSVRATIDCEVQMSDQNWRTDWHGAEIRSESGRRMPLQVEKEESNLNLDWRKRVVFSAELPPARMVRFHCRFKRIRRRPTPVRALRGRIKIEFDAGKAIFEGGAGGVSGVQIKRRLTIRSILPPTVFQDGQDPWSVGATTLGEPTGEFRLLSSRRAAEFAGGSGRGLAPVRVIEDGPVRTVIESLWGYGSSRLCQRMIIPRDETFLEFHWRVHWAESSRALKFGLDLPQTNHWFGGQTMFGVQPLPRDGREAAAQRWVGAGENPAVLRLALLSDSAYGFSVRGHTLWMTLLRSPHYAALPIGERPLVDSGRFNPVIDQGVREFRWRIQFDPSGDLAATVERQAQAWNESPIAYSYYPDTRRDRTSPKEKESAVVLSNPDVTLVSARPGKRKGTLRLRLFSGILGPVQTTLTFPGTGLRHALHFGPMEVKTVEVDLRRRRVMSVPIA